MNNIQGPEGPGRIKGPDKETFGQFVERAVVRIGEQMLSQVAERLGIPLDSLLQANPQIGDPDNLQAGQEINVPAGSEGTGPAAKAGPGSAPAANTAADDGRVSTGSSNYTEFRTRSEIQKARLASALPADSPKAAAEAGEFKPGEIFSDLESLARFLENPVDNLKAMIAGADADDIHDVLKLVDQGLQKLEDLTGLKTETSGRHHTVSGEESHSQSDRQLGNFGTAHSESTVLRGTETESAGKLEAGIAGVRGEGSFAAKAGAFAHSESEVDSVLGQATNESEAWAGARTEGEGSFRAGVSGLEAQGQVEARAGAGASTQGRVENALGRLNYQASAEAGATAGASGQATLDVRGLQAEASAEVGVSARAEASADFQTAGLKIGGETLDLRGQGTVSVEAAAKAEGKVEVNATWDPPRANAEIGGSAFAGAKAEAEGSIGLGEFVTLSGEAGAWAGAGAEGFINIGFDDGKLSFGFGGGAAVGYGFGAGWNIEVDAFSIAKAAIGGSVDMLDFGARLALDPAQDMAELVTRLGDQFLTAPTGFDIRMPESRLPDLDKEFGLDYSAPRAGAGTDRPSAASPEQTSGSPPADMNPAAGLPQSNPNQEVMRAIAMTVLANILQMMQEWNQNGQ